MAMDETKSIDEPVVARTLKNAEFQAIGSKIAAESTPVVVAFVDLAESTQMKQELKPEEWLGFVFEFIKRVGQLAIVVGGTVVKRIGDELMLRFDDVQASENFVSSLITDSDLKIYGYKVALDYGKA
jgi:class 3 adenylate cyclase